MLMTLPPECPKLSRPSYRISQFRPTAAPSLNLFLLVIGGRVIDDFAANDGLEHADGKNLRWWNFRDVLGHHREVGQFSFFDLAFVFFFKFGVSGLDGVTAKSFFEREPLLGVPSARRIALRILPRDGRVDSVERIHRLAGKIGT